MNLNSMLRLAGTTLFTIFILNQLKRTNAGAREIISGKTSGQKTVTEKTLNLPKFNDLQIFNEVTTEV